MFSVKEGWGKRKKKKRGKRGVKGDRCMEPSD